jgi:hypothetical protein
LEAEAPKEKRQHRWRQPSWSAETPSIKANTPQRVLPGANAGYHLVVVQRHELCRTSREQLRANPRSTKATQRTGDAVRIAVEQDLRPFCGFGREHAREPRIVPDIVSTVLIRYDLEDASTYLDGVECVK